MTNSGGDRLEQISEGLGARGVLAGRVNAAQIRKSGEIDAVNVGTIGNKHHGAGILQLITYFPLAIRWIKQRRNGSGQCGGVIGGTEFPGVRQEDGYNLAGAQAIGDEATSESFDCISVVGIGDAASGGGIDEGDLPRIASARLEDQVMEEEVVRIGVELRAEHAGTILPHAEREDEISDP
jgi:hypothetical protein